MSLSRMRIGVALSIGMLFCSVAQAQYPYPGPYGYPGYGYPRGQAGTLYGRAQVISATGDLMNQQEQARIAREQANQAKIDTKRKTFDEMQYEKANTPSFTEEQEKVKALQIRRYLYDPRPAEVTNGTACNAIMPMIRDMSIRGIQGPTVTIDQDQLKSIKIGRAHV